MPSNYDCSMKKTRYMQYVSAVTIFLGSLLGSCSNMISSWNSPAIAKLTSEDSPIGVTLNADEASWVASISLLGFIVGAIIAAPLLNKFGPKRMLLFSALPIFGTWIVIAFTKSVILLIVMRCISGIGDGLIIAVLPLYLGEITDKDIRGSLTTTYSIMTCLGGVFVLSVGPFVSYVALTLSCAVVPLLFVIIFIFLPDSPYYLYRAGKTVEGNRVLKRLLQSTTDEAALSERIKEIELSVKSEKRTKSYIGHIIRTKNFRTAILLLLGAKFVLQFSGVTVIKSYLQTIIGSTDSSISPEISSIIFGVVQLPSVILAAFLMDKLGRKPLYIISSTGCAIALITEGAFFYLEETSPHLLTNVKWLPTVSLTTYLILAPIGINSVPFVLISEMFSTETKGFASSVITVFTGLLSFTFTRFFLPLSNEWGMYSMFWIFGCTCLLGLIFGLFILPETKGKSFLEIQDILTRKSCC